MERDKVEGTWVRQGKKGRMFVPADPASPEATMQASTPEPEPAPEPAEEPSEPNGA